MVELNNPIGAAVVDTTTSDIGERVDADMGWGITKGTSKEIFGGAIIIFLGSR